MPINKPRIFKPKLSEIAAKTQGNKEPVPAKEGTYNVRSWDAKITVVAQKRYRSASCLLQVQRTLYYNRIP